MKKSLITALTTALVFGCSDDDSGVGTKEDLDAGMDVATTDAVGDGGDATVDVGPDVPPEPGELVVEPVSLTFSDVRKDEMVTKSIAFSNVGGEPILVSNLTLNEINRMGNPEFVKGSKWFDNTATIEPGTFSEIEVTYAPHDFAVDEGRIEFNTTDPELPSLVIPIDTINAYADIDAPKFVRFGTVDANTTATEQVIIFNRGVDALTINDVNVSDPENVYALDFSISDPPVSLGRGDDWAFDVTFSPTDTSTALGTVTVESTDPDQGSFDIALSANDPAPCISVTPGAVDFGEVAVDSTGEEEITLLNCSGTEPLDISTIELTDDAAGTFSLDALPSLPAEVNPRQTESFKVVAGPSAPGEVVGTLSIESSDTAQSPAVVELRLLAPEP